MYIKKILLIIVLLGAVGMGVFAWYVYDTAFSGNTAFNNSEAHVYIPTNATMTDVMSELEPFLKDSESFLTVANQKKYTSNIKPGHYIIRKGMTNNDIVNVLRSTNVPIDVKFNNQERLEDLAGHISKQIEADSVSLLNAMRDSVFLKEEGLNEENALSLYIPNTYEFYWNSSAETFRNRMKTEYERFWNESRMEEGRKPGAFKRAGNCTCGNSSKRNRKSKGKAEGSGRISEQDKSRNAIAGRPDSYLCFKT